MIRFHIRSGAYLVGHGTCQVETRHLVVGPEGSTVVFEPPPGAALQPPPEPGARWNLDTREWDRPEVTPEHAWAVVRARRDDLLAQSDWVTLRAQEQGAPVPPEWLAYRQALRDVTTQGDPLNIDWPNPPA